MTIPEGCCFKCKKPLFIEVPGRVIGLCPDCTKEFEDRFKDAAKKKGKNAKDVILHHPKDIRE
jgi:uncharacterized Zn finger protein (UPF0148 family)